MIIQIEDIYKFKDIDDLYLSVTKLTTHEYNGDKSVNPKVLKTGTGFFYESPNKSHYLITNRHIVIDENFQYFPNVLRVYLHINEEDLTENKSFDIQLYKITKKQWLELENQKVDVVVIPVDDYLGLGDEIIYSFSDEDSV